MGLQLIKYSFFIFSAKVLMIINRNMGAFLRNNETRLGFAHPRTVQILSEETVYNSSSQKPTRVLILDRPLEGDGVVFSRPFDGPVMPSLRKYAK